MRVKHPMCFLMTCGTQGTAIALLVREDENADEWNSVDDLLFS